MSQRPFFGANAAAVKDPATAAAIQRISTHLEDASKADRDSSAAYAVTLKYASSPALGQNRTLTVNVKNGDRTFGLGANIALNGSAAAPTLTAGTSYSHRYGGNTNLCGDPDVWLEVEIDGTTYRMGAYLP